MDLSAFRYYVQPGIPTLAWCVVIEKDCKPDVYCGVDVECTENAFVEGAWEGDYSQMNFSEAKFFCGSGGYKEDNGYCFVTPNHVLEKIVAVKKQGRVYLSNSVPFILEKTGCALNREYLEYERDFSSVLGGLDKYVREIPLAGGEVLLCYYYCNVIVDSHLNVLTKQKKVIAPVVDYYDYYQSLLSDMQRLKKNACDPMRRKKYGIVTTISTGYDAAACAVIAKKLGCDTALTFNEPQKYADDCGEDIARIIGYTTIIKKDANEYLQRDDKLEAEHVCSGELGTSIVFSAFENEFRGNLVFYGERGDKIWNKNYQFPNDRFEFRGEMYAGISMTEFRLRVGFILIPMPMYKATTWTSIHRLSNCDSMKPWSLGNDYDRPIPRKMVEDCGVPREMFGQRKKGAGFNYHFDTLKRLRRRMSPQAYEDFVNYYKLHKRRNRLCPMIRYYLDAAPSYINYLLGRLGINFRIKERKQAYNPGVPSYLIAWGMDVMVARYSGNCGK